MRNAVITSGSISTSQFPIKKCWQLVKSAMTSRMWYFNGTRGLKIEFNVY
jgi:hypothetical protein